MVFAGFAMIAPGSDATGEDLTGYGQVNEINIGPGYSWTYTPTFPSDLTEFITVSLQVNDLPASADVSGGTVSVTIPSDTTVGDRYNVVIKASMTSPVTQTSYQWVRFTVVSGLDVSGTINDIIAGSDIDFTPTGTASGQTVTWSVKQGTQLPAGLSLMDGKVTGTPTTIGTNTVSLTATSQYGESKDLVISFVVFAQIAGGSDETIFSTGNQVSSAAITNHADLHVTWAVDSVSGTSGSSAYSDRTLAGTGFSLDPASGAVSGSSATYQDITVILKGTSAMGSDDLQEQTASKKVTIHSEPVLTLTKSNDILTYKGNLEAVSSTVTASGNAQMSLKSWSVSDLSGASVSDGIVSIVSSASAGMSQSVTVTCSTAFGQSVTIDIPVAVEDTLSIAAIADQNIISGTGANVTPVITGGSSNTVTVKGSSSQSLSAAMVEDSGTVHVDNPASEKSTTVTLTVTSAAGQSEDITFTVNTYSQLTFTNNPTGGAIIYATNAS